MKLETSTIRLREMRFYARHGVGEQERTTGADFAVSLSLTMMPAAEAFKGDKLSATVNYAEAYNMVKQEMERPSNLLENVCYRIARRILDNFKSVISLRVAVRKVNPPIGAACDGVEVELTASRDE